MLQIDHAYEFFYNTVFTDFDFYHLVNGVPIIGQLSATDITIFTPGLHATKKIFFYDQEPLTSGITDQYFDFFTWIDKLTVDELQALNSADKLPHGLPQVSQEYINFNLDDINRFYKNKIIVTSELSKMFDNYAKKYNTSQLYYFFHGFAALDWYRGFYALNYNKSIVKDYKNDFISFNRLIAGDRSYRIYFISKLAELDLLKLGLISFGVAGDNNDWRDEISNINSKLSEHSKLHIEQHLTDVNKLIIDNFSVPGWASADIPRCTNDSLWHIVTETVFYYDKLHLTEKIFKPIVSKQPFMLLAAPGNLAYLKSYGFKTFDGIIDESYDTIIDNDQRTEAVVAQIAWYCALSVEEKRSVIEAIAPIVEYNFHHFYSEFKHIITKELLDNCRTVFKEISYNDQHIDYTSIHHVLTN